MKRIRGELLIKHYDIVDRNEEYEIRKSTLPRAKLIVKYTVIEEGRGAEF